jgi:hypothetical protein
MFATDPKKLEFFKKYLYEHQQEIIEERAESIEGKIVLAIQSLIYIDNITDISAKDIIEKANLRTKDGSFWHSLAISKYLKELGFSRKQLKRLSYGEPKRCLIIDPVHLSKLVKRYKIEDDERPMFIV